MKKIVINTKHGGFGLSPKALASYMNSKGKQCYFFESRIVDSRYVYILIDIERDELPYFYTAFTLSNPNDYMDLIKQSENSSKEEKEKILKIYEEMWINEWEIPRDDHDLIKIVEAMGCTQASGKSAELKIVEIPDDVDWVIEEYDGLEWIAEKHRTWS